MKIDLPLGSECLLANGMRIEPVESPGEFGCYGCILEGLSADECEDQPLACCGSDRNDGRHVHFHEVTVS